MEATADYSAQNTSQEGGLVPLPAKDLGRFTQLNLAHIRVNPDNPRRHFDEDELAELANSIKIHGIRSPIEVRHIWDGSDDDEGFYQIIAGERRFRAADMIGLPMVPVLVRDVESDTEAQILALVENMQRANLNPIEEATAYENLMKLGVPQERIAAQVGVQQSLISRRVGLLRLPESVKVSIASGKLSATHGVILNGISESHPTIAESFGQEAIDNQWNVATLTEKVNSYRAEMERQAKANAEAAQPRLLDTEPAPIDSVKSVTLEEQAKLEQAKQEATDAEARGPKPTRVPQTSTPPLTTPSPVPDPGPDTDTDNEEYTGDEYVPETTPEASPVPVADPAITELPKPTPTVSSTPTVPRNDIEPEPAITPGTGARVQASMLESDDDWLFEQAITIDQAFATLRANHDYRLTSLGRKIVKALTGMHNDENPNEPVTPALRLQMILESFATAAGFDTETLKEIPE